MLLTVKERILLLNVLPKESDLFTQRIVKDLKNRLGLSEEDWKTYEVRASENGRIFWNSEKDKGAEISVGDKAKEIIVSALKDLDKQKKVNEDFLILFDKFLPSEKESPSK